MRESNVVEALNNNASGKLSGLCTELYGFNGLNHSIGSIMAVESIMTAIAVPKVPDKMDGSYRFFLHLCDILLVSVITVVMLVAGASSASASRLPQIGQDNDVWGIVLNDFLNVSLEPNGTLKESIVNTSMLLNGSVTNVKLSFDSVTGSNVVDGSVSGDDILDDSISADDIQDGSIASADIAIAGVSRDNIADGAVSTTKILDATITGADIQDGTISGYDLQDEAVAGKHIEYGSILGDNIAASTITTLNLEDYTILNEDIADGTIAGEKIDLNAELMIAGLSCNYITVSTINATDLTAASIESGYISSSSLSSSDMVADSLYSVSITADTITASAFIIGVERLNDSCIIPGCIAHALCSDGKTIVYGMFSNSSAGCVSNPSLCSGYCNIGGSDCTVSGGDGASVMIVCANVH